MKFSDDNLMYVDSVKTKEEFYIPMQVYILRVFQNDITTNIYKLHRRFEFGKEKKTVVKIYKLR